MASNSCVPSSSSSSSPAPQWEVFLSFRGEDTREKFVDHLYTALYQKGIPTFKDDEKLEKGRSIGPELNKAIKESQYYIVVLSENYASSRWCLDELVHIRHSCSSKNDSKGRRHSNIYPVFYHVDPSNVRHLDGRFGEGFGKAASKHGEAKAQMWREALKEVADLTGWVYPSDKYRSESKFIQELVGKICSEGDGIYANVTEDLVGIHCRVEKVIQLLSLGLNDHARAVGIWGMGGIGKTTIAREVYCQIRYQFEALSFLENVREVSTRSGLATLQRQLIYDTLGLKDLDAINTFTLDRIIRNRVCNKKVLIVLDDVDQSEQLENLIGKLDRFNVGSRIIITTQDKQLLAEYDVRNIYNVEMLEKDESIKLFISKAFGNKQIQTRAFEDLVKHVAEYGRRLPLALKVLGSSLKGKKESEWKSALNRLQEWPNQKVLQALKISYDALNWTERQIFLDIACFYKGKNRTCVTQILDSCGLYAEIGISTLVDKCLISSDNNTVWMHDLIQELGWDIARQESSDLGGRSRLWLYNDVYHVLMNNTGTEKVKGIVLRPSTKKELLNLGAKAFAKLTGLRFLEIYNVQLPNDLEYLSNELRYLDWDGCPLKCFPQTFRPEHLFQLTLSNCCLEQLWDGKLPLPKLRSMCLYSLTNLTECPDVTGAPELKLLVFRDCKSLVNIHQSVGVLTKLEWLSVEGCRNLKSLPTIMDCKSLQSLVIIEDPIALSLFGDAEIARPRPSGRPKLINIPEFSEDMKSLTSVCLEWTGQIELPLSVGHLENLDYLDLRDCQNLESLPDSICQLKALRGLQLVGCPNLRSIPDFICQLKALESLSFEKCSNLEKLPSSSGAHLMELKILGINRCKKITSDSLNSFLSFSISRKRLYHLEMRECNLKSVPAAICSFCSLTFLKLDGNDFERLPAGMNQLTRLGDLYLEGCKRLEELPEFSTTLNTILAFDCQSLRTISPSTYKYLWHFDFCNCIRLLGNEQILENEQILDELLSRASQKCWRPNQFSLPTAEIRFPGSEIPKWFSRDKVELHSTKGMCLGYAACAVVEIEETYKYPNVCFHETVAQLNIRDRLFGDLHSNKNWRPTDTETLWITFGGLRLLKDELDRLNELGGPEFATFTITSTRPGFKIKSCGLRLWFQEVDFFDRHNDDVVEEEEEEEDKDDVVTASMPKRRRLDNVDDDDDEEEEERHPNNKKPRQLFEPKAMDLDLNEEETVGSSRSRSLEEKEEDPSMDPQPRI